MCLMEQFRNSWILQHNWTERHDNADLHGNAWRVPMLWCKIAAVRLPDAMDRVFLSATMALELGLPAE